MATSFLFLQLVGDVAAHDALGQAFHDGGLADAGLADEHGVVLGAAAEHLHDAADFVVAADDGVELALAGGFGEIEGVALERLVFGFGILVGDALRAADGDQGFEDGVVGGAGAVEQLAGGVVALVGDGQQEVLGGDELVLEVGGFVEGASPELGSAAAKRTGRAGSPADFGQVGEHASRFGDDGVGLHVAFFEHGADDAFLLLGQGDQQMQREADLVLVLARRCLAPAGAASWAFWVSLSNRNMGTSSTNKHVWAGLPRPFAVGTVVA